MRTVPVVTGVRLIEKKDWNSHSRCCKRMFKSLKFCSVPVADAIGNGSGEKSPQKILAAFELPLCSVP